MDGERSMEYKQAYDVQAWAQPVHVYDSIDAFIAAPRFYDGVHCIKVAENQSIDLLFQGFVEADGQIPGCSILIGFTAAVPARSGKKAPFFSGMNIARSAGLPLIAVADPTLGLDEDLPLGWYAGNASVTDLSEGIARLLDAVAYRFDKRLILFGGSNGGFAALRQATLLHAHSTILVWNPQTSISEHLWPRYIIDYIVVAFPHLKRDADDLRASKSIGSAGIRKILDKTGVVHDVCDLVVSPQADIIYLQNQSDEHVGAHATPYFKRYECRRIGKASYSCSGEGRSGIHFGNWGNGHVVPPLGVLVSVIRNVEAGLSVVDILAKLDAAANNIENYSWLDDRADLFLTVRASAVEGGVLAECEVSGGLNQTSGWVFAFYLLVDGVRVATRWYEKSSSYLFDQDVSGQSIKVIGFAKDAVGQHMSANFELPR